MIIIIKFIQKLNFLFIIIILILLMKLIIIILNIKLKKLWMEKEIQLKEQV